MMKSFIISVLVLTSSYSFASGFVCSGQGYNVKLYNQTQPELGTKNPAVLIVSSDRAGTLAVLKGDDILKTNTANTFIYSGLINGKQNGRFMSVELQVVKQPVSGGAFDGQHFALLTINADSGSDRAKLACSLYLKN
jgi:hypothetical protein